jgi:hypothetical protein
MRKLIILALIVIANSTFAQNKDTIGLHTPFANGEIAYQKTFRSPGKSMTSLFNSSRSWFEKRYNDLDSVKIQDSADGRIVGTGWEVLSFKGPLGMDVPSRVGMTIEIRSKEDSYSVYISHIVLGYLEDPEKPRTYFTVEDLMNHVLGKKYLKGTIDPVPFNIKRSKKALESLNALIGDMMTSVNQTMNSK